MEETELKKLPEEEPRMTVGQGGRRDYWSIIKKVVARIVKVIRGFWRGLAMGIGSLILILLLFSFLGGGLSTGSGLGGGGVAEEHIAGAGEDKIVYISFSGLILEEAESIGPFSSTGRAITPGRVRDLLAQAETDNAVKGVILGINSPGGSAVASNWVWEEMEKFSKPSVALMGDVAASGGYLMATACDQIIADESTITGSIGTIAQIYNLADLYEKLGIKVEVFKRGEFKDILSEARERTDEEKAMLDGLVADSYDSFLNKVAQGREMELDQVKELAEGKIYSGKKAQEVGLVDETGDFDQAVAVAKELVGLEEVKVVEYSTVSLWDSFFGGMGLGVLSKIFPKQMNFYPRVMYLLEI